MDFDARLLDYCQTDTERKALEAIQQHGTTVAADAALGRARSFCSKYLNKVKVRAAREGYAPGHFTSGAAPGYLIGKVTIQRGADGEIRQSWERQHPDAEMALEALRAAASALVDDITPVAPQPALGDYLDDLIVQLTVTDFHLGMLSWAPETGADWDAEIAETVLMGCMAEAIHAMPAARTAVLAQLGDFLHYDSILAAVTPTSGHNLDADSRFPRMVEVAVRCLRACVEMMLEKFERVHIIMAEGNHDLASSVWLRVLFAHLYRDEPRVTVDTSAAPYYCVTFGKVFLGFHHSHLKQIKQLPSLMAAQFPEAWGRTTKRYCHTGDKHHWKEADEHGIHVIQHPTLASRDAYAARGGWFSQRSMQAISYHRELGMRSRYVVPPEIALGITEENDHAVQL